MPVKMRLQRKGRRKNPFYHIVVADARAPRDGRFIEKLGVYNPMTKPATIDLDRDKAFDWLLKGAQPTDTVRAILRFKGVMYRKHLMRGVNKEAMTQEDADRLYQEWIDSKEAKVATRAEQTKADFKKHHAKVSGIPAPKKAEPVVVEEVAAEAPEVEEPTAEVEEAPAVAEVVEEVAAVVEEAPAAEEATEESAEEPSADPEEDEDK
ncbi:MAG: 30S ribosomal protein S16 [Saprospirales bacterium]|nr:30S ribosomal protein S16 [Saprospirales bacterium]MBK8490496.1 30S ribosomal protein S16 [Saprospirales bacterium]